MNSLPGQLFVDQSMTTESSDKGPVIGSVSLSPVPCYDFLNLSFICIRTGLVEFSVYNAPGVLVKSLIIPVVQTGNQYIRLDLHDLPDGFYMLRLKLRDHGNSNVTSSFLVKR